MLTVEGAAHKRTNMAVAIDAAGREVARWRGPHSVEGWQQLAAWAKARDAGVRWGIAGAWNDGRGLAQQVVEAGATCAGRLLYPWRFAGTQVTRVPGSGRGRIKRPAQQAWDALTGALLVR